MKPLFLLTLLCLCGHAFGQEMATPFYLIGKAGIGFANQYGPDATSETRLNWERADRYYANHPASRRFQPSPAFFLGIGKRFGKLYALEIGAGYVQKGAKIHFSNVDGSARWKQEYLSIPLYNKFYVGRNRQLFFVGGAFLDVLLRATEKGKTSDATYERERGANPIDGGVALGVGYDLNWRDRRRFALELIDHLSFVSYGREMVPQPQRYYNQSLELKLAYRLAFR
ncbi:Outer membrane protein beta-barrel domain-containing protein [Catalinimonas alkaloidigena]|uniref:Outer membrane protein beta-barrel domain-containing protein n=1 Tax=Catalinimonas alkaloidigena TaxID=1075417 RepID=A0A1G9JC44_9BACT|nr:porin family protein [Catalinimonas alkaloidigena]SDL34776.1 Outer membrane protein beta-barrel domain-containing protein [Catalinimonas alkaloidigena]